MRTKRILTILLVVALTIVCGVINVAAQDNANSFAMAVEVTSSTAMSDQLCILKPGDSIEVSVMITENTGLKSRIFAFDINYDAEALDLVLTEDGDVDFTAYKLLGDKTAENVVNKAPGTVTYKTTGIDTTINPTGKLVTLKFVVKETFEGTISITVGGYENMIIFPNGEGVKPGENVEIKDSNTPDYDGATIHAHNYGEPVVQEPTCTSEGTITYTCTSCEDHVLVVKNGDMLPHTPGAEATCTTAQVCTGCGVELAPALGHTAGPDATCTDPQSCTVCGDELVSENGHVPGAEATCTTNQVCIVCNEELVAAKGHTPGAEATCTTNQTCTVCNEELVAAKGHTPGAEATCTTAQTCTVCNTELAPAKGHTPGEEATCTTAQKCTVCEAELVAAKGHTPGAEATCTTAQKCTVCDAEVAPAKGHTPGAAATCTTAQVCTACNTELAPAKGHTYGDWVTVKEPTTKEEGAEAKTCPACGDVVTEVLPMLESNNTWVWIVIIAVVVLAGGGFCLYWFVFKKKK